MRRIFKLLLLIAPFFITAILFLFGELMEQNVCDTVVQKLVEKSLLILNIAILVIGYVANVVEEIKTSPKAVLLYRMIYLHIIKAPLYFFAYIVWLIICTYYSIVIFGFSPDMH